LEALPTLPPTDEPSSPGANDAAAEEEVPAPVESDSRDDEREFMVSRQIQARGVRDLAVLAAMQAVPRHEFVPTEFQAQAYDDHPLPIGYGQTISQPYVVALMTESLALEPDMRVLEIGTGSGYQAAVLAEIVAEVYTVEIIEPLAEMAAERLTGLGYDNVEVLRADGYFGWEEHAPFDAIIVTAAPDHMPQPLILQMADESRLVVPIGPVGAYQELWLYVKTGGELQSAFSLGGVAFVPLTRDPE
jgi:protein-L-isoaspartate(D-aspartate) O-methyltransferase